MRARGRRETSRVYERLGGLLPRPESKLGSEHYDAARTVRVRDGVQSVPDGPVVTADEYLTGYFTIEVESIDAAVRWAAQIPNARTGSVEVRPVIDIDR